MNPDTAGYRLTRFSISKWTGGGTHVYGVRVLLIKRYYDEIIYKKRQKKKKGKDHFDVGRADGNIVTI